MSTVLLVVIGLITGALTGFGGGSAVVIVVPALTQFLHIPFRMAVGTSLTVDVLTSALVSFGYAKSGNIQLKRGWIFLITAILGPQIGIWLSHRMPTQWLGLFFAVTMILFGTNFIYHAVRNIPMVSGAASHDPTWKSTVGVVVLGLIIGIITGLLGASGGVMYLLALVYGLRYTIRPAVGTSVIIMAISALSGAVGYSLHHEVYWTAVLIVGLISMVVGYLVARMVPRLPERIQAGGIGTLLFVIGLTMLPQVV
ncbi:MAG: hypothetical protein C7B47_09860 [Sulfobacillus thermosulfidooxidans]|uniref:Probable membrane transporter protein n=1 Tax=Sulfobacillus thermosulfidooxidans TaxID=28034 RepID=A0A2T2WXC6_SULTH|nr:MAG: hypothetical protein C7B47_09860 [Sulfobacillus thermosulfidooxidans]